MCREAIEVRTKWCACLSWCSHRRPGLPGSWQYKSTTAQGQALPCRHRNSICPCLGVSLPQRGWFILTKPHTKTWKLMYSFEIRDITHYILPLASLLFSVAVSGFGAGGGGTRKRNHRCTVTERSRELVSDAISGPVLVRGAQHYASFFCEIIWVSVPGGQKDELKIQLNIVIRDGVLTCFILFYGCF